MAGCLGKPWRDPQLQWTEEEYEQKRRSIASRCPLLAEAHAYKILLVGAVASGKSSLINTFLSAIRNEIVQLAYSAVDDVSVSTKFRVYRVRESVHEPAIRVTLCDTRGFEQNNPLNGPSLRDMEYIMDGHIKDGYEFKPNECIRFTSPYYVENPGPEDNVQVMVVVVDISSVNTLRDDLIGKVKEVTALANARDIRWAIVLTKVDQVNEEIAHDISTMFSSDDIEAFVEQAHIKFGAITSNIFPMRNYDRGAHVSLAENIVALSTLESILRLADNALENQSGALPVDIEVASPPQLLTTAWRGEENMTEDAVASLFSQIVDVKPEHVDNIRLCYMGPSGAGKSTFVNSVISEMFGRIVTFADTGAGGTRPTTAHYTEYQLQQGRGGPTLPVQLIDTMGFAPDGMLTEDIRPVLDGRVTNGEPFNSTSPLPATGCSSSSSSSSPQLAARMHMLVLVVNAAELANYPEEMLKQLLAASQIAKELGIARTVLLSHIDRICEHVSSQPTSVYRSQQVKSCIEGIERKLHVHRANILPVCSYYNDTDVSWQKAALILQAFSEQIEQAQDYIARAAPAKRSGWFW